MDIKIQLYHATCEITIQRGLFDHLTAHLRCPARPYSSIALLAPPNLLQLYGETVLEEAAELEVPCHPIPIPDKEAAKTLAVAESCWHSLRRYDFDRESLIIALGGGTTGDVAGFVAALYMRGIRYVQIPTTLLAMVDASIGGKTAINLDSYKNMIGAFHQPSKVLIDPACLQTLDLVEFTNGLAEVLKYGMIADAELFRLLEDKVDILPKSPEELQIVIETCAAIKARIVEEDEREEGKRALLNWGHTFGHALESLQNLQLPHGQAVSIGMSCAAHLSHALGLVDTAFIKRQDALIRRAGLPHKLPQDLDPTRLIHLMHADKKSSYGGINCIVAEKIGQVRLERQVKEPLILQALKNKQFLDAKG